VDAASIGIGAKALAGATAALRRSRLPVKAFVRAQTSDTVNYELDQANFNTLQLTSGSTRVATGSAGAYLNSGEGLDPFFADRGTTNIFFVGGH
jgi:hypothetical protein